MCGISGFIDFNLSRNAGESELQATVLRMADTMRHRGPDDGGAWADAIAGIALGHRRLAIIDLSPEGHQPMRSPCGRFCVVFNGEIYNFGDLRQRLERMGHTFRGHSDTEVILAAISQWGVEAAVKRFVGMFAFALWDRKERVLSLVRDRLGEKPLYYGWVGNVFLFGSELKSLRKYPGWQGEIDRNALALYMRHNYIPAPHSIYKGIYKLPPATILSLPVSDAAVGHQPVPLAYWSAKQVAASGAVSRIAGSEVEAVESLDGLLREAIAGQMVADVPLGAFLSGGVDSSTVVALMQAQSKQPVKTFTIGFHEASYNEAEYAKAVARHLGTEHTELYVRAEEAMAVIPLLPTIYDEPFSDSSQIPTFLVSKLARQHVTVSLSGDGGDELFAGYPRYFISRDIWQKIGWIPRGLRNVAGKGITTLSPKSWNSVFRRMEYALPATLKQSNPGDRLHKLSEVLTFKYPETLYYGMVSHWKHPASLVLGSQEPDTALTDRSQWAISSDFTHHMMYLDTVTYLPNDILVKVDRASMGVSLESRTPFLDHRVVEFAWRVPLSMKIRNGRGKWLLRQVLHKYVPRKLIERPKMGFGVPIDVWLRGPLRDWAESLLNEKRLRQEGFFEPALIQKKWDEHLSGECNWQHYLWDVLMFQAWRERWQ